MQILSKVISKKRVVGWSKAIITESARRLSGSALVVPRRKISSQDYVRRFQAQWYPVHASMPIERRPANRWGKREAHFESMLDPIPELGVLELKDGFLSGPQGWVISREGFLLPEHSWYGLLHSGEMKRPWRALEVEKLRGVCLLLTSDWASINYGHFLLDGLCRFDLFQKAGFSISDIDYVYCAMPTKSAKRMLRQLGIPSEKCIVPKKGHAVQADVLLAPSFPGTRWNYPQWTVEFLRETFLADNHTVHRRLYIPRTTTRRIVNEEELMPFLFERGFEVFDPAMCEDPPAHFAEAAVVVGGHGAGLADLAFCQKGTQVLELIPSDHIRPYWYTLSEAGGLRYSYLVGNSIVERLPFSPGPSPYNFSVDKLEFAEALNAIL